MLKDLIERKKAKETFKQIRNSKWLCISCEETHEGLFDLAAFNPDFWNGEKAYAPNNHVTLDGNFLSEDFCVINGENFFVRCVLDFPIKGFDIQFGFGVWSSLSKINFKKYLDEFDNGNFEDGIYWSSWFSNRIKGIENIVKQKCWVNPQSGRKRPLIYFMDDKHPVSLAQQKGMEPKWLLDIYAANGHSLKTPQT